MKYKTIDYKELHSIVNNIFYSLGCSLIDSNIISNILIEAELRGIPSHGVARVNDYSAMVEAGRINTKAKPKIIHEMHTTATIDGDNAFGMIPAVKAMKLAVKKADKYGSGWVSVINSNHYGIAGYYSMMALDNNMIGISMTNANALVAPTFSVSRFLGTNPIAVAIPAGKYPPFVADFATTPIARGKLALMEKKGEKSPLGFIQDHNGNDSTDPSVLKKGGAILPLGSDYLHGSHKGYCLSAIVDIFSAVLGGANFGPFVPPQVTYLLPANNQPGKGLGHFFGAFRVDAFQPAEKFFALMENWIETFKNAKAININQPVLIPGEPEEYIKKKYLHDGIPVLNEIYSELIAISNKYK